MNIFSKELLYIPSETEKVFVRPDLTANGTMGGNAFAVSDYGGASDVWKAFDSSIYTYWQKQGRNIYLTIYNPKPLNITQLQFTYFNQNYRASSYELYGNNNGSPTGGDALMCSSTAQSTTVQILNNIRDIYGNTNYQYKYYVIKFTTSNGIWLSDVAITATYME